MKIRLRNYWKEKYIKCPLCKNYIFEKEEKRLICDNCNFILNFNIEIEDNEIFITEKVYEYDL